ncbi:MAG: tetratricopeptide repeat protein [Ardenticatenaceae bacterium]|nr:tetratricopeptide repeat protein [Ardenticatenaceae bacterium]MCB9444341.1 tetratricopeptide repeat protein [Ardenticatenaceae bacterium]
MTNETHIQGDFVQGDKFDGDKVMRDKHEHHHYPPPQFPLDNLPPANPNFTGRAALLDAIQATFDNRQSSIAITQAIAGLGGVGKTQLALAYAHARRSDYDLIWQVRADEPAALDGDLRQLGMVLRLPVQNADAPTARQMVLSRLNGADWRWLLLYDNADQINAHDLRPYLPGGRGHVLITSRRRDWSGTAPVLVVNVFTPQEAVDFLLTRARSARFSAPEPAEAGTTNEAVKLLVAELGYLPLALEQAAAYMKKRQKSAAEYLALYRERRQELWQRQPPPDDYEKTVTTTWEMAFDHARQTPGAADLLNLCCFLAPDDIPLALITANADALPEELAALLGDEMALDDALDALQAYSLVTQAGELLAVHRLVQTVARDRMGEERAKIWTEAAVELLNSAFPYSRNKLESWGESAQLITHALTSLEYATRRNLRLTNMAHLYNHVGQYLDDNGEYPIALTCYQNALKIREEILGHDHLDTAVSLNNLGYLHSAMGDLAAARPYYERALAITEKALGPGHPDTARSLNNLGGLLRAMGDLAAARPYYERALAIREKALGPDHPDTAQSLNNLGFLLQAMGDLTAARPYYERALAIREKALGPDHPDTAGSLNNLGALLRAMGDLATARPYYERALAIREKALGPDHPDTALSLNNLGALLRAMGDLTGAKLHHERALTIREKTLGPDHPDTATTINDIGVLLHAMGNLEESKYYRERALKIYKERLGPEHPWTATALSNLGYLHKAMGELNEAKVYFEQALAIYEKRLGPQHPDTQRSRRSLEIIQSELKP